MQKRFTFLKRTIRRLKKFPFQQKPRKERGARKPGTPFDLKTIKVEKKEYTFSLSLSFHISHGEMTPSETTRKAIAIRTIRRIQLCPNPYERWQPYHHKRGGIFYGYNLFAPIHKERWQRYPIHHRSLLSNREHQRIIPMKKRCGFTNHKPNQ